MNKNPPRCWQEGMATSPCSFQGYAHTHTHKTHTHTQNTHLPQGSHSTVNTGSPRYSSMTLHWESNLISPCTAVRWLRFQLRTLARDLCCIQICFAIIQKRAFSIGPNISVDYNHNQSAYAANKDVGGTRVRSNGSKLL